MHHLVVAGMTRTLMILHSKIIRFTAVSQIYTISPFIARHSPNLSLHLLVTNFIGAKLCVGYNYKLSST